MKFTHLKKQNLNYTDLQNHLLIRGYLCERKENNLIKFRLDIDNENIDYNINMYSGRKGRYLSYEQWEEVNEIINTFLDHNNIICKVVSNNIFTVRTLQGAKNQNDWYKDLNSPKISPNQRMYILNGWS